MHPLRYSLPANTPRRCPLFHFMKAQRTEQPPQSSARSAVPELDTHAIERLKREMPPDTPTVFQALGRDENRFVLRMFVFISALLVVVGFGSFFLARRWIPSLFPSITRYDSPIYACVVAVVLTQAIVFAFYFWAWRHDVAEERREKQKAE